jgi:hypothetical protein
MVRRQLQRAPIIGPAWLLPTAHRLQRVGRASGRRRRRVTPRAKWPRAFALGLNGAHDPSELLRVRDQPSLDALSVTGKAGPRVAAGA